MNLSTTTVLYKSALENITGVVSTAPLPVDELVTVLVFVRRPNPGISLKEYADGIVNGAITQTLSHSEFEDQYGVLDSDFSIVSAFADQVGLVVSDVHKSAATLKLSGTAAAFNRTFGIVLTLVTVADRTFMSYSGDVSIPVELNAVIDHILGFDNSAVLTRDSVLTPSVGVLPDIVLTPFQPQLLKTAYNFPPGDGYGGCIGILEYGGGYNQLNLDASFSPSGLPPPTNIVDISVDGATNTPDTGASAEVVLDIVVAGFLIPKAKIAVYFAPNDITTGFPDSINAAIHDKINCPSVLSISWGLDETVWQTYSALAAMDTILQAAVILGVTICTSTGDYGSKPDSGSSLYRVGYPASSPYVLAVGGTGIQLNPDSTIAAEVVWNQGNQSSSGGTSTIYPIPSYQTGLTVKLYPSGNVYTFSGRAIPDVSADADPRSGWPYVYYGPTNQGVGSTGGTSAAAPVVASAIVHLNTLLGRRLGFLNSTFYQNPQLFNDITSGNNAAPLTQGYSATVGWDACTGLGSPNVSKIYQLFNTGGTFPKLGFGFRPASGAVYPRPNAGTRID